MKQLAFVIILLFSFHVAGAQTPTRLRLKQLELAPDSTGYVIMSDSNRVAYWENLTTFDTSITNEIQQIDTLSLSGTTLSASLSSDGVAAKTVNLSPILSGYLTGSGTATRVAFWNSSSALSSSANLYWDNSNNWLGIGTASPTHRLSVYTTESVGGISLDGTTFPAYNIKRSGTIKGYWTTTTAATGFLTDSQIDDMIFRAETGNVLFGVGATASTLSVANLAVGINRRAPSYALDINSTGGMRIPVGTTAQRPTGAAGVLRYNTSITALEVHNGTTWHNVAASTALTSTRIPFANSNGVLTDDDGLIWNATSNLLGIGGSPSHPIHAVGSVDGPFPIWMQNNSSGTGAAANLIAATSSTRFCQIFKAGPSYTTYKTIKANDSGIYNSTISGDMSFLNDFATGDILFAAGGSSTVHMGLYDNGRLAIGNTSPQRTLHLTGEARITDLTTDTPTRIVGADADGDLGAITVGAGLILSAGTLAATGTGTVTGSGTTDYIPKFTSSTALGNSVLQESSSKIGIGVTPAHTLDMESATDAIDLPGGTTAQRPTNESELLRYNSDNARVEYADGTNWRNLLPSTSTTGSAILPAGTTGERDGSPSNGYIRYNSTTGQLEAYVQSAWANISASPRSYADMVSSGAAQYTVVSTEVIDTVTNIVASGFTHSNGVLTYTGTTNKNFLVNISAVVGEADTDAATAVLRLYQNSSIKGVSQQYCALQDKKYAVSISRIVTLATNDTLDCRLATGGDWIVSNFYFNVTPID